MDKAQAIHSFWSGFELTAYDENTVPNGAQMPYITYGVSTGALDDTLTLNASIWYRSPSWADISAKADQIAEYIGYGYRLLSVDGGYLMLTLGNPFSQRMADESDDMIRRLLIRVQAEFLTAY